MNHEMSGNGSENGDIGMNDMASTPQTSLSEEKSSKKIVCNVENGASMFLDLATKKFCVVTNFQFKIFGFSEDTEGNPFFIFKCEIEKKGAFAKKEW